MAAYLVLAACAARLTTMTLRLAMALVWSVHGAALVLGLAGDPVRFGFAPALSVTLWLVLAVFLTEREPMQEVGGWRLLAGLCSLALALVLWFPGAGQAAPRSAWLPLHWALGFAAYGLFGAALAHAWMMARLERRMRGAAPPTKGMPLLQHERLAFRFVGAGFALLSATLVAGWLFGEQLHGQGHNVKLDHKIVFSHLSWLTFAALLAGRLRFGWRGKSAVRVLYAGCGLLLLAYVGSRFVLEVVLGRGAA
jgi:ABC-type uncharacterized transport system permease subunit